jgi:hypothetical protein
MILASGFWPQNFSALHHNFCELKPYNGHLAPSCQGTPAARRLLGPPPAGDPDPVEGLFPAAVILLA